MKKTSKSAEEEMLESMRSLAEEDAMPDTGPARKPLGVPDYAKISVTMFPADMKAADDVLGMLWDRCGVRGTRSNAIRMALRLAVKKMQPDEIQDLYEQIRRDDRRFKAKK